LRRIVECFCICFGFGVVLAESLGDRDCVHLWVSFVNTDAKPHAVAHSKPHAQQPLAFDVGYSVGHAVATVVAYRRSLFRHSQSW
jgi:hypothetical protein